VQSDKLSSPIGSMTEGLNKDPASESTFSTRISSVPVADSQGSADANAASQFRSPLLRQMMGNKLAAGCRSTSATNDVVSSAPSDITKSASQDSVTSEETETVVRSASYADRPSEAVALSTGTRSGFIEDEVAVCDTPLEPSPRITAPVVDASLGQDESTVLKPVPIEVWTEESAVTSSSCRSYGDHDGRDDKDEMCIEDEPLDPSPRPEEDTCQFDRPDKCASDSKPDPSSNRSDHSGIDDKAELCVEDAPLEPSSRSGMDADGSGKLEERTSVVDEDRDIDTTETLRSDVKVDHLLVDTSKWNGVEKLDISDPSSSLFNGYPDDDVRM